MDTDQSVQMSALGGTDNHLILGNPWLNEVGHKLRSVCQGVRWDVCLPVIFGKGSPWGEASQCLADFRPTPFQPVVDALQWMFLATALNKNGTPTIRVNKEKQPDLYKSVLRSYVCYAQGWEKTLHKDTVDRYVTYEKYFDPAVVADLRNMRDQVMKERVRGGRGYPQQQQQPPYMAVEPRVQDIPRPDANANMDEWAADVRRRMREDNVDFADLPEEFQQLLQQHRDLSPAERWVRDNLLPVTINVLEESLDLFEESEYRPELEPMILRRSRINVAFWPLTPSTAQEEQQQQQRPRAVEPELPPVATNTVLPKVHTTLFRVTDKLALFRFCVLDPQFSLDIVRKNLTDYGRKPENKVRTGNGGRGYARSEDVDPFQDLRFLGNQHIVNEQFSKDKYLKIVAFFNNLTGNVTDRLRMTIGNMYEDHEHPLHLAMCCTLERSLRLFEQVDPASRDTIQSFRVKLMESCIRKETGYAEGFDWYMLHPEQCFWAHRQFLGIGFTRWPYLTTKENFAADLLSQRIRIINGELVQSSTDSQQQSTLSGMAAVNNRRYENPLVDKEEYQASLPNAITYKTGDQLMKWEKETLAATKMIQQLLPKDPEAFPERYRQYCEARARLRESGLDKFCSFWCLDGVARNKPVAPSIKALVTTLNEIVNKTPGRHLTTHLSYMDDLMTCWGNTSILRMTVLATCKTIINAKIPFIAAGLNSTFDLTRVGQPRLHIQLCGPPEAGKTFPLLGFIKSCYVKGTWESIHSNSKRAFNADIHIGPRIALCDEPPKWVTRKEAEDQNYEAVQEMKDSLISHQHSRVVLEIGEHNGQSIRVSRNIVTDDATTWAYCTNQPRDKNHPLGTRMFQVTVPLPTKPPEEYQYDPGEVFSGDATVFFNIDQILTVSVYCAIRTGAIPDVDMTMAKTVLARIYALLRNWNVIDKNKGNRSLEIMCTFIRHQAIIRAVTATYHLPGGPLYKQPYDPAQVHHVGPRLFPTLEIIFAVIHMMASEIIDEEVPVVWKALCRMAKYDMNKTALENYCTTHGIDANSFKQTSTHHHQMPPRFGAAPVSSPPSASDSDRIKVDLNYLSFQGTLEEISKRLVNYCKPPLSDKQILDVLKSMKDRQMHARDARGYRVIEASKLELFKQGQDIILPLENDRVLRREDFIEWLTVRQEYITVCSYHDTARRLFIAPEILDTFDVNVLDQAFYLATVCSSFPRIKAVRGMVYDDHPDLFEVAVWDDNFVTSYVNELNSINDRALKRTEGCAIPTRERMTRTEQDMLLSVQLNPARQTQEEDFFQGLDDRSKDCNIIRDWELEAAKRAAFLCGVELNHRTVFWTDKAIREAYDDYCARHELDHPLPSGQVNYPLSIIEERKSVEANIAPIHEQLKGTTALRARLPLASPAREPEAHQRRPANKKTTADRLKLLNQATTRMLLQEDAGPQVLVNTAAAAAERAAQQALMDALND